MLQATVQFLVAILLANALARAANQEPLGSGHHPQDEWQPGSILSDDRMEWIFDKVPHPNATEQLVFETVHSFLQHWPNTRMRNGHNIVPGTIPKGTLLYHGTEYPQIPPSFEWVATDPEHSFIFCRDELKLGKGCWQLTLATTRPLKVVYFDGNSAAKHLLGTLDTQDLIASGVSGSGWWERDLRRFEKLCEWGKDYMVDGFVRMEMDFEVVLCDFSSGVEVVSFLNLHRTEDQPLRLVTLFEVMNSGSWHNHFPGDTRIQLDLSGLISFYDTELAPSLVPIRADQERWDHRVWNISSDDLSTVKSRLEEALARPPGLSSGIDWATLINVIVDRYAGRLELIQYLLNLAAADSNEILDLALKTQTQLRVMITPYALFSAAPADPSNKTDMDWAIPIFKLCATTHTSSMDSEVPSMTPSERLLLRSVRGTSREICRVVTKMWAAGVHAGLDPYLNTKESPDINEVTELCDAWAGELSRLMSWLDWSVWVKCRPACGPEEMCYLPTFPVGFPREEWDDLWPQPVTDEWIRPQPKCIRRLVPYGF